MSYMSGNTEINFFPYSRAGNIGDIRGAARCKTVRIKLNNVKTYRCLTNSHTATIKGRTYKLSAQIFISPDQGRKFASKSGGTKLPLPSLPLTLLYPLL